MKGDKFFGLVVHVYNVFQCYFIEICLLCIIRKIGNLNIKIIHLYPYRLTIVKPESPFFSLRLFDIIFFFSGINKLKMYLLLTSKFKGIITQIFRGLYIVLICICPVKFYLFAFVRNGIGIFFITSEA